ncbi:hypothetical protein H9P43_007899 [Blastocladiella emersonii ATCC 22665]|nr:hypothetical protein H9P43_007899 [Blastocladiella emersonii ATCC 22665]
MSGSRPIPPPVYWCHACEATATLAPDFAPADGAVPVCIACGSDFLEELDAGQVAPADMMGSDGEGEYSEDDEGNPFDNPFGAALHPLFAAATAHIDHGNAVPEHPLSALFAAAMAPPAAAPQAAQQQQQPASPTAATAGAAQQQQQQQQRNGAQSDRGRPGAPPQLGEPQQVDLGDLLAMLMGIPTAFPPGAPETQQQSQPGAFPSSSPSRSRSRSPGAGAGPARDADPLNIELNPILSTLLNAIGVPVGNSGRFNLGDFAFGQEHLDAIAARLHDQATDNPTRDEGVPETFLSSLPDVEIVAAQVDKGLDCPVCQEKFALAETVTKLPCDHLFHKDECLVPWLELHRTCPTCRLDVVKEWEINRDAARAEAAALAARGGAASSAGASSSAAAGDERTPGAWMPELDPVD